MPFPMKIQPIEFEPRELAKVDTAKPVVKSRLKRLFDRPFTNVLRSSSTEKPNATATAPIGIEAQHGRDVAVAVATDFEPSSVCLAKMVQNFMEETNEKQSTAKCGRNRCNCFNGNKNDSSDDELDLFGGFTDSFGGSSSGDASDLLKSLIPCASIFEKNLLADTATIIDKNKNIKRKDDLLKIVTDGLSSLGYDSSICKSSWEKSPSFLAGEYEYIDVIFEGDRILIDVDFSSEFEIARQTGAYKAILQSLPFIFVGKPDRLRQIVSIVSEAAKQSLKKKGMHLPPWRKAEYMRAKWLSPHTRASQNDAVSADNLPPHDPGTTLPGTDSGELQLIFGEETVPSSDDMAAPAEDTSEQKSAERATAKPVTGSGLASLLKEIPQ